MKHDPEDTMARWELPLDQHPALEVTAEMAMISIVPTRLGEKPFVEVLGASRIEVNIRGEGGTTHVHLEQDVGFFGFGRDKSRTVLHVPGDVRVRVRTEAGRLRAERLHGCRLTIETDAGEVQLRDVHGAMRVLTGAGKIDGEALAGSFDFATTAGAIYLDVVAFDPGKHRVTTSVGAVKVDLARGLAVNIDARTTMGTARVVYPSQRDAPAILDIEADVGAIKVRESSRLGIAVDGAERGPYRTADVVAARASAPIANESTPDATSSAAAPSPNVPRDDSQLDAILRRVADGSLSPRDAGSLLRALGHG